MHVLLIKDIFVFFKQAPDLRQDAPVFRALQARVGLQQRLSRLLGLPYYIVARKSVKPYMEQPLVDEVNSITTQKTQTLCLDGKDALAIHGKRVALVDDVISTGESLQAIERLVEKAGAQVVARAAILAEGDAANRDDILFLEPLPLFPL